MRTLFITLFGIFSTLLIVAQEQLWTRTLGGTEQDIPSRVKADNQGSVYSMGEFEGTVDFDPGNTTFELTSNSFSDPYLLKLDIDGNFLWAKSFPFAQDYATSSAFDFVLDDFDNLYVVITYQNTIVVDGNSTSYESAGETDILILKIDPNGALIWSHTIGSTSRESASHITKTEGNELLIMGYFDSNLDFDSSANSEIINPIGDIDTFILKINTDGEFIWVKQLGTPDGVIYGNDLNARSNTVSIVGSFKGTVDFDPSTNIQLRDAGNTFDGFVLKLDVDGNFQWVSTFESEEDSSHWIRSSTIDTNGNIIIGGGLAHTVDFDPGPQQYLISPIDIDAFIVKLNSSGNLQWAVSFGGIDAWYNEVRSIATDAAGNIISTGKLLGTTDFDPDPSEEYNLTSFGKKDTFLLMLSPDSDLVHASHIGGPEWDVGTNLYVDQNDFIYLCSTFRETADLEFGENETLYTSNGEADIFLTKIESNTLNNNSELFSNTKISIYPNPSSGNIEIVGLAENELHTIFLYDTFGKLIKIWENVYNKNQLYLEGSSGIYILKIKTDKQIFIEKLIKE